VDARDRRDEHHERVRGLGRWEYDGESRGAMSESRPGSRGPDGATRRRQVAALVLAGLLVLSGCSFMSDTLDGGVREDPASDRIGWEDGYWYNDPLSVDPSDGLNSTERRHVVARTMARVEKIRGIEFDSRVPVEVINRTQYRERRGGSATDPDSEYNRWNDQVWEALFLVDEDASTAETFDSVFGSSVQGYYAPGEDEIVIVSDTRTPTLDRATLSHELVHALQDQEFGLGTSAETQDAQLAEDGLIEGDANVVEARYESRCDSGWSCLPRPDRSGSSGAPDDFNYGLFTTVYAPYASGPDFVGQLEARSGWDAVNNAYDSYPVSTEQIIHPNKYPDDEPDAVSVPERSSPGWERFDVDPEADTVGEASIYAMFWANDQLPEDHRQYNYSHPLSDGWGGDSLVPYRNDGEYGYVWKTTWDSRAEAREFVRGYRQLLRSHDARKPADGVFVIPESNPYADAFRVTREGDTVTIVNAPDRGQLNGVQEQ
jgi:hypothetical protein